MRSWWRVWSSSERRAALSGLVSGGASGYVAALVGGVGGSVSSVLLGVASGLESAALAGDRADMDAEAAAVRAAWRLGDSCPLFDWEEVSALLSEVSSEERSEEFEEALAECLSFVWVDASRRWVVLPRGVSHGEAVARFVAAWRAGEVPVSSELSELCPLERAAWRG